MKYLFLILILYSFSSIQAQDWPNLKKYHSENLNIINSDKKPTAVFMGNSITEGWWQQRQEFFEANNFVGRGIGGQTTPQMLIRFTPDVLDLKPEVVVILAGTNDIAGNTGDATVKMITDNLAAMAQLARAHGIKVVLSSILPVKEYPWNREVEAVKKIAAVNNWIENYSKAENFVYLDYFNNMADHEGGLKKAYSGDGVHPNIEGYTLMEPLVLKAIHLALE